MDVIYTRRAQRDLRAVASVTGTLIVKKMRQYAASPAELANQVIRLKGSGDLRMRVGDYRVIFTVDGKLLTVLKVGHRSDIYD